MLNKNFFVMAEKQSHLPVANFTKCRFKHARPVGVRCKKTVEYQCSCSSVRFKPVRGCTGCDSSLGLFGVLRRFQHCTGHITTGSWKGRGNQYIEFARVVYCKLPTNGKQLPAFPLKAVTGIEPPTSEVGGESVTTLPPWPLTPPLDDTPRANVPAVDTAHSASK